MKHKITMLALCVLVCGTLSAQAPLSFSTILEKKLAPQAPSQHAGGIRAPGDYETVTRTGIVGDADQVQNFALNPAFRIFGNIAGPATPSTPGTATSVAAIRSDLAVFTGVVSPSTGNYAIVVPAGTYNTIRVCYGMTATTTTFDDSQQVIVTDDTLRNETLTGFTTSRVSGLVNGIDAGNFASLAFTSQDLKTSGSAVVSPFDGSYSTNLPDGIYNVAVIQFNFAFVFGFFPVGTVTVSGIDVTMDFTIGSRAQLSGTVTKSGGIPANSNMLALDSMAPPVSGFNCASATPAGGLGPVDQVTGGYGIRLLTGYRYFLAGSFPIYPADPPQSAGTWTEVDPITVDFVADTVRDETASPPANTIVITGQVTAAAGPDSFSGSSRLPFCPPYCPQVTADGQRARGAAPPSGFSRATQADAAGNYRLVVPMGLIYTMTASVPPSP